MLQSIHISITALLYTIREYLIISNVQWLLYVPLDVAQKNDTFSQLECIYVFYMDLRTNSDSFPIQH